MKWTEEQTINFVREFVKYECLYNINCIEFKIKPLRHAALLELSSSMCIEDFGPREAYLKIRSLKSTYSQELKKVRDSKRSGGGTSDIYVPNVKWFRTLHDALLAVNSNGECRETQSNLVETVSPLEEIERKEDKDLKKKTRKRLLKDYDNLLSKVRNVAEAVKKPVGRTENEFDIFGKSIAAQLKNMPLDVAIETQSFMQNYLSNVRLKTLRDTQCSLSHSNYSRTQTSPRAYGHDSETSQNMPTDPIYIKVAQSPEATSENSMTMD